MIRAVIFDLDGLLTDTERLHSRAWRQALAEAGVHIDEDEYADFWVRQGKAIDEFLQERDLDLDAERLRARKDELFAAILPEELRLMPGASELLDELEAHVPLALVSSSRRASVVRVVEALDLARRFEILVAYEDAPRGKPHPDPFLHAAARLGVAPEECVVLEDAEKGVLAAHRAGMISIAVPHSRTANNDFSRAALVVASLEELNWPKLRSLGEQTGSPSRRGESAAPPVRDLEAEGREDPHRE